MKYRERTYRSYSVFFKAYCLALKFECDAVLRPGSSSSSSSSFFFFFFLPSTSPLGSLFRNIHPSFQYSSRSRIHVSLYDVYIQHYASSFWHCDIRPRWRFDSRRCVLVTYGCSHRLRETGDVAASLRGE